MTDAAPPPVANVPGASGFLHSIAHKALQITHGRTTAFFVMFFIAGHAMAAFGKLTGTYIGFMGTLGGLVLGHSIKEDVAASFNGPRAPGGHDNDTAS